MKYTNVTSTVIMAFITKYNGELIISNEGRAIEVSIYNDGYSNETYAVMITKEGKSSSIYQFKLKVVVAREDNKHLCRTMTSPQRLTIHNSFKLNSVG